MACVGLLALISCLHAAPKKEVEAQQRELELLKTYLGDARDSLQREIANRWRQKQRFVEQRELDKEELERLRNKQEQVFAELGQMKEEVFARERLLEDTRKELETKQEEWNFVTSSFTEVFEKEARALSGTFPLDMEQRRRMLEELRREFGATKKPEAALSALMDYHTHWFGVEGRVTIGRETIMPDDGELQEMTVAQFGTLFAYALNDQGEPYVVRQTGKLGGERYTIEKIGADQLATHLREAIPMWVKEGDIARPVTVDVMQNANSSILISGEKVSGFTRLKEWFRAGGPVMVPLMLLALWGLALMVVKCIQFHRKHKTNQQYYGTVAKHLKEGENDKALDFARKHRGVVAKVVVTCLEHARWNRASAEKAVRELLVEESPQLNKHLATLAVIAGAAPLLGLLGTVTGMISLFEVITHYGTSDPKILAGGISEALVTTETGLIIAIPVLLGHNFLRNQSVHIHTEMEKHAIRILNRLWPET